MKIERHCPFCFGKIFFENEGDIPHAGHTTPTCKTYDEATDALDFIVKVNKALGNTCATN